MQDKQVSLSRSYLMIRGSMFLRRLYLLLGDQNVTRWETDICAESYRTATLALRRPKPNRMQLL